MSEKSGEVQHPDIKFIVFFPPYSILTWIDLKQKGVLSDVIKFKEYIYTTLLDLGNVEVYDFQGNQDITHNLDNYKDLTHYSPAISQYILSNFEKQSHLISDNNYLKYVHQLQKQIDVYPVDLN